MAKTPQQEAQAVIDRLTAARDSDRLRSTLVDDLAGEPFSRMTEWAESLTDVAEKIDAARDAIESWQEADDREGKADAKEEALSAVNDLLEAWDASPLDLTLLEDWTPEEGAE